MGRNESLAAAHAKIATGKNGDKVTLTDMLLQALADTLSQTPAMLDRWLDGAAQPSVTSSRTIDIGLVVALEHGLLIPTLSDLANKDLAYIAGARREAIKRVRAGRLIAIDHAPASIALSNLGKSEWIDSKPSSARVSRAFSRWGGSTSARWPATGDCMPAVA